MTDIKKVLLVRNDNVGDLICTTPAIEALRKKYPNIQLDIVVNSYNYSAIDKNPFVDKIYCYTKPKHKKSFKDKIKAAFGKLKILIDIKKQKYDAVVVFRSDYSKSAELFSKISGAKYRVGVKSPKGKDKFNIHVDVNPNKHEVEFCFDCLEKFGVTYQNENTRYFVKDSLKKKYRDYKEYILFHISSRVNENRYDKKKFQNIFDLLPEYKILISAEPQDLDIAQWLEKNSHVTFIKTSSLEDLSGLIKNSKIFVTLDGGAMHIAPALGVKTVSISGKTNMKKWYPWGYKEFVLQSEKRVANEVKEEDISNCIKKILDNLE